MSGEPAGTELDPARLVAARWFARKGARIEEVRRLATVSLPDTTASLSVVAIRTSDGIEDLYTLPGDGHEDADPGLWRALFDLAARGGTLEGDGCRLHGTAGPVPVAERAAALDVVPLGVDQSHTTVVLGGSYALKCYRHLAPGEHPEIELTRALAAAGLAHIPPVHGSAVLELGDRRFGLLHLQTYLPDAEDGFAVAKRELGTRSPVPWASACGRVLAELHGVLSEELGSEPAAEAAVESWGHAALAQLKHAEQELTEPALTAVRSVRPQLERLLDGLREHEPSVVCRIHGDLHIGQFLRRQDGGLAVIDFEGEPGRSTDERRAAASPMRDLATLLRSFDHAGFWVQSLGRPGGRGEGAAAETCDDAAAEEWITAAREACVRGYRDASAAIATAAPFAPRLLAALEAEKAVNELLYAQRFVPEWTGVATNGLLRLCR